MLTRRLGPILLFAAAGLASVAVGWMVTEELFGLPFFIAIFIGSGLAMVLRPDWGLVAFILFIAGGVRFLPQSGYGEGLGIPGLNALTLTQFGVWGLWLVSFAVRRDRWVPLGWLGKAVLVYTVLIVLATLRLTVVDDILSLDRWVQAGFLLRAALMLPLTVLLVLQTRFSRTATIACLFGLVIMTLIGSGFALHTIFEYGITASRIRALLSNTPGSISTVVLSFGVCASMALYTRGASRKIFWISALLIGIYPLALQQSRATYLAVAVSFPLALIFATEGSRSQRAGALAVFGVLIAFGTFTVADRIIARLVFTFYSPWGTEWVDPSVGLRFLLYETAWELLLENPDHLFWGMIGSGERLMGFSRHGRTSFHNLWITNLMDYGIMAVIALIVSFLNMYRLGRDYARSHGPNIVRAFGAGIAAAVVGYQVMAMTHTSLIGGYFHSILWCSSALLITHLRPGGMYEFLKDRNGRYLAEKMGLHSRRSIEARLAESQSEEGSGTGEMSEDRRNAPAYPSRLGRAEPALPR